MIVPSVEVTELCSRPFDILLLRVFRGINRVFGGITRGISGINTTPIPTSYYELSKYAAFLATSIA